MNIGIVGAGNLGTGLAKQLTKKGHAVMLSFSTDVAKLRQSADSVAAKGGTPAETAAFGEVIVLATPWTVTAEAIKQIGVGPDHRIICDCTNALKRDLSGLAIGTTTSGGEEIAKLTPWAKVVKAIPPFAEVLHSGKTLFGDSPPGVFFSGDDAEARKVIASLVEDIGGAPAGNHWRSPQPVCQTVKLRSSSMSPRSRGNTVIAIESSCRKVSVPPRDRNRSAKAVWRIAELTQSWRAQNRRGPWAPF